MIPLMKIVALFTLTLLSTSAVWDNWNAEVPTTLQGYFGGLRWKYAANTIPAAPPGWVRNNGNLASINGYMKDQYMWYLSSNTSMKIWCGPRTYLTSTTVNGIKIYVCARDPSYWDLAAMTPYCVGDSIGSKVGIHSSSGATQVGPCTSSVLPTGYSKLDCCYLKSGGVSNTESVLNIGQLALYTALFLD